MADYSVSKSAEKKGTSSAVVSANRLAGRSGNASVDSTAFRSDFRSESRLVGTREQHWAGPKDALMVGSKADSMDTLKVVHLVSHSAVH